MVFLAHLQGRKLFLLLPLGRGKVTHIPMSIKMGRVYKAEKSPFYSTFKIPRQVYDDTRLFIKIQAHSSKFYKYPTVTFNELKNLYSVFFLSAGELKFRPASYNCHQVTTKRHTSLLIPVFTMEKCKQNIEFQ